MRQILFIAACSFVLLFSFNAFAVESKIGIIDLRKVIEESEAGKNIASQLKTRQESIQKEAAEFEKKLKAEEQDILAKRKDMKAEEFTEKKKSFEQDFLKSRQTVMTKSSELDSSRKQALAELQKHIAKISADVAKEKKLEIIIDRQFVILAEEGMDISADVMAKLNSTVKAIPISSGKK